MKRWRDSLGVSICIVVLAGAELRAQAPPTVWHALGIPQSVRFMRDSTANRRGNRPNMERRPPMKRIADPENLKSDVPAIKAAADIKTQQDLAPQKIKAIKYLATIGCGCYGGVAEALMAALEDCTEEVRYEAAKALMQAINCKCEVCSKTCCTKELAAKMYERAYGRDENGCFLEPSDRVRDVLAQVLNSCPPDMRDIDMPPPLIDTIPRDTMPPTTPMPLRDAPPAGTPGTPPSATSAPDLNLLPTPAFDALGAAAPANFLPVSLQQPQASSRRTAHVPAIVPVETAPAAPPALPPAQLPVAAAAPAPHAAPAPATRRLPAPTTMVTKSLCGEVVDSKTSRGYARIMFSEDYRPPVGTELQVYHEYVLGPEHQGSLVILDYEGALAVAGPRPWQQTKVSRGDTVECTIQVPELTPPSALPEFAVATPRANPVPAPTPAKTASRPIAAAPASVPAAATGDHPVSEPFARSVQKAAGNLRAEPTPAPTQTAARGPSPVYVAPGKIAPRGAAPVAPSSVDLSPSVASAIGVPAAPADPLDSIPPQPQPRRAEPTRTTALPVNFRQSIPKAGQSPTPAASQAQWLAPIIERNQLEQHTEAAIASQVEEQFAPIVSAAEAAKHRK